MDYNLVVKNEWWAQDLETYLFGEELVNRIPPTQKLDMLDILVLLEVFPSKGQARKNWKATTTEIPDGFTDVYAGKMRQRITIWKPIAYIEEESWSK